MKLRDYQLEDVERIKATDCLAIFSEQRTGKTPTTIRGLWDKGIRRPLIVCPNSLVYAWKSEYEAWTEGTATVVTSTKFDVSSWTDGALIINYEKLRDTKNTTGMWKEILKAKPEAVVLDEAHRIKSRGSATAKACFKLCKIPVRLALTGTPAPNKEEEIFNILRFLFPSEYTSYWRFVDEWFSEQVLWVNGSALKMPGAFKPGKATLFQDMLNEIAIQHKRKDVMKWLEEEPDPIQIKLPCTPQQAKYITELNKWYETEHLMTQNILENIIRIRQVCGAPSILGLKGKSPKLEWLRTYFKDNPDKSIIVFSNSTQLLNLFYKDIGQMHNVNLIVGATPVPARQEYVNSFQSGETKVLLIQTQAGKEGLTLDQADVTIFLDTYPPAADYLQAKDRMVATKPERVKPKEIIHIMMAGTYDEQLYKLVNNNVRATAVINDYIDFIRRRN